MVTPGNTQWGYYGRIKGDKKKKYNNMHKRIMALTAEIDEKKVKHFLDSPHGRHIADYENEINPHFDPGSDRELEKHISRRWGAFSRNYKPAMFEAHSGMYDSDEDHPKIRKLTKQGFKRTGSSNNGWTHHYEHEDGRQATVEYGPNPGSIKSVKIHEELASEETDVNEMAEKPAPEGSVKSKSMTDKNKGGKKKLMTKEEFTQLDELSKKTLGSYIKKAASSLHDVAKRHGSAEAQSAEVGRTLGSDSRTWKFTNDVEKAKGIDYDSRDKMYRKSLNRRAGIAIAAHKLTKEEFTQLDEVSRKTLASYVRGAVKDKDKRAEALHNSGGITVDSSGHEVVKNTGSRIAAQRVMLKTKNRNKGIDRALNRLAKEEIEMNENHNELVAAVVEGEPVAVAEIVDKIMTAKTFQAVQAVRDEMEQTVFNFNQVEEEYDPEDEDDENDLDLEDEFDDEDEDEGDE